MKEKLPPGGELSYPLSHLLTPSVLRTAPPLDGGSGISEDFTPFP